MVSGYAQKFKMAEASDNSCSREDDEYSDPLEEAASAGARLSVPEKASISRKRKVPTNPAEKKRNVRGSVDPKVSAWDRLNEFKDQCLTTVSGNLRCDACRETISKKKSSVKKHVASVKHIKALENIKKSKKKDQNIKDLLAKTSGGARGSTLPEDMRLYRYELVEALLKAGIPLSKVDSLRPFLEKYGHRLTTRSHLAEFIPTIHQKEIDFVKSEIAANSAFSVIFDGSTRLGEALAIVVRFIDKDWNIQQRLLKLEVLAKSMNGEELAQRLIQCLAVEYKIQPNQLLAAMRDGASVNEAGLRQVMFFFPNIFNVICFSHTIDNVGKHFEFSVLDTFSRCWNTMFSLSPAARLLWKTRTGTAMRLHSKTRWWSKWEVLNQVMEFFGDVEPFLRENDNLSPVCRASLLEIFDDPVTARDLDIELAAMIDAGKHFVQATYYLEGDGLLVFACYERLSALAHAIAIDSYPNTEAKARQHAGRNMALYNQLVAQGKACINPGYRFYQQKFSVQFHNVVRAFKGARLCCPVQVQALRPTAVSVQELKQFSFITDAEVVQLVEELPNYLATADGAAIETEEDKVHWWATHAAALPNWSAAVKKILLVQPSSASAKRVFSLLQNAFSKQQEAALEETVETSVMLRYNDNKRT